jgi:hypothetical protein
MRNCSALNSNSLAGVVLPPAIKAERNNGCCWTENPDEDAGSAYVFVDLKLFRRNLELMLARNQEPPKNESAELSVLRNS